MFAKNSRLSLGFVIHSTAVDLVISRGLVSINPSQRTCDAATYLLDPALARTIFSTGLNPDLREDFFVGSFRGTLSCLEMRHKLYSATDFHVFLTRHLAVGNHLCWWIEADYCPGFVILCHDLRFESHRVRWQNEHWMRRGLLEVIVVGIEFELTVSAFERVETAVDSVVFAPILLEKNFVSETGYRYRLVMEIRYHR